MVRSRALGGLFARIRWRLVGWSMLTLGLILVLLGTAVYVAAARSLLGEFDNTLLARSEQFGPSLFGPPGRRGPEGYRGGVFFLAIGPDGSVIANPQQVTIDSMPTPQGRAPEFTTVTINDEPTRLLLRRMPDGGLLITGESLQDEQEALHSLLVVLVAGGGVGLLLSLAGAWFLSGRALVPIQQAFQRQQEFVADASHELRTPLTVLRSATDVLNQHRDQPIEANGELFDDVRAEIIRMERLAQDLLTLARSDTGELELMTAPIDLADVAADVVRRTTPLAQANGVQLGLESQEGTTVDADPDRLQQVALILIDNAIKHTPSGGRVDVRVRRTPGTAALLEVIDTGSGIAPEHLPRIFDRFYRGDKARARAQGGTGLGLAIARTLVEAHGGQLSLTSQLGVGTHVTLTLPLAQAGGAVSLGERLTELAAHLPHAATRH
ncbi:MAG: sensor histidine kinase [Chloroflexi bacterium]|nr:sensor histidine kinase [Chloroflexota bacterium]